VLLNDLVDDLEHVVSAGWIAEVVELSVATVNSEYNFHLIHQSKTENSEMN
jgi:hypothetical protein